MAQFGSVLEWGSRGRKFESSHPDVNGSPEIVKVSGLLFILSVNSKYSQTKLWSKLLERDRETCPDCRGEREMKKAAFAAA